METKDGLEMQLSLTVSSFGLVTRMKVERFRDSLLRKAQRVYLPRRLKTSTLCVLSKMQTFSSKTFLCPSITDSQRLMILPQGQTRSSSTQELRYVGEPVASLQVLTKLLSIILFRESNLESLLLHSSFLKSSSPRCLPWLRVCLP